MFVERSRESAGILNKAHLSNNAPLHLLKNCCLNLRQINRNLMYAIMSVANIARSILELLGFITAKDRS